MKLWVTTLFLILASVITSCDSGNGISPKESNQGIKNNKNNIESVNSTDPQVEGEVSISTEIKQTYGVSFVFQKQPKIIVTFDDDLKPVIEEQCLSCHKLGGVYPNLSSIDQDWDVIIDRLHDKYNPMPPSGKLDDSTLALFDEFIRLGKIESYTPSSNVSWTGYQGKVIYSSEQGEIVESVSAIDSKGKVSFQISNPNRRAIQVQVIGPKGTLVYESLDQVFFKNEKGDYFSRVGIRPEDHSPPVSGASDQIKFEKKLSSSSIEYQLSWTAAVDDQSIPSEIEYQVILSERILSSTREALELVANESSAVVRDYVLSQSFLLEDYELNKKLYFSILAKDKVGNISLVASASRIFGDEQAPTLSPTATIQALDLTDGSVRLTWAPAADNLTLSTKLKYKLYFSAVNSDLSNLSELPEIAEEISPEDPSSSSRKLAGLVPGVQYHFNVVVSDEAGNQALYQQLSITTPRASGEYSINQHGQECAERLGYVEPFNFLDGELITIEVSGIVPADGYPNFSVDGSKDQTCDNPAMLQMGADGRCTPHSRLGRIPSYKKDGSVHLDVDNVFICRRYTGRNGAYDFAGQIFNAVDFPIYDDIGIIQHNRVTGETCYFQMLASKDGRRVPPPSEIALPADAPEFALSSEDFWLDPEATAYINCGRCHDSDPWIHTPYLSNVRLPNGETVVPSHPHGKYSIIGKPFAEWELSEAVDTSDQDNNCTSCHRIGNQNTCSNFMDYSLGQNQMMDMSEHALKTHQLKSWMPLNSSGTPMIESDFHDKNILDDYSALKDCCQNPNAPGCVRTPIMTRPPLFQVQ